MPVRQPPRLVKTEVNKMRKMLWKMSAATIQRLRSHHRPTNTPMTSVAMRNTPDLTTPDDSTICRQSRLVNGDTTAPASPDSPHELSV